MNRGLTKLPSPGRGRVRTMIVGAAAVAAFAVASRLMTLARTRRPRWYAPASIAALAACAVAGCGSAHDAHRAEASISAYAQQRATGSSPTTSHRAIDTFDAPIRGTGRGDTQELTVQMWLRPAMAAAERFATAVSTPGSPAYREFLTPDAYTARFGATLGEASQVNQWLRSRGFSSVSTSAQRDYVQATGTAARIDAAFHLTPGSSARPAQARDEEVALVPHGEALAVPRRVARDVLGVTGAPPATALGRTVSPEVSEDDAAAAGSGDCSAYFGQRKRSGLPRMFGTTTFPLAECGHSASQYRSAYGANMTNTGIGQTIAFDEAGGLVPDMFQTLRDYARQNHLPAPSHARYDEINEQPASCAKDQESTGEEQMDVEAAYAMAPLAAQIVVGANLCQTGTAGEYQPALDADVAIINGNGQAPLASVVSNSWETGYDDQPARIDAIETAFLVKAAAVGVGMYYSAGDSPCVTQPASNPYATGVGGTTLAISRTGRRVFETGGGLVYATVGHRRWQIRNYFGYGGGQSRVYRQPDYQKGVVPASMSTPTAHGSTPGTCRDGGPLPRAGRAPMRSAPDVSASTGNFNVGLIRNGRYITIEDGGTSLSAPLVAGMVIAAQQGQRKPFGFINPALHAPAGTSAFYDPRPITAKDPLDWRAEVCPAANQYCGGTTALWLTDDQSKSVKGNSGQVTTKGYDNTTGVGVPNGQAFITAMRHLR